MREDKEIKIIEFLRNNPNVTCNTIAKHLKMNYPTTLSILAKLVMDGKVMYIKDGGITRYKLADFEPVKMKIEDEI